MQRWTRERASPKKCVQCGDNFMPHGPAARYCSRACGQRYRRAHGIRTTEDQYRIRSGNWSVYYNLRLNEKDRKKTLTVRDVLDLHGRQNGLCALTGVPLTCELVRGKRNFTNASIDRKVPGGPYTIDNIQLVCSAVNQWRGEIPLGEFVEWCRKVVDTHERKTRGE